MSLQTFGLYAAIVGLLAFLLYRYCTSTFNYFKIRGVPYLQPTPFFGNIKDLVLMKISGAEMSLQHYSALKQHKFGGVFYTRKPGFLICDPELIKHFIVKDFNHFHDRGMVVTNQKSNPLSAHLFNLEGNKWRNLRAKLTPTFTPGKMKMMFDLLSECAAELVKVLEEPARNKSVLEIREIFAKYTTDVIGTCAFGLQFNSLKDSDSEFRKMGRKVFSPSLFNGMKRLLVVGMPPIARLLNIKFASEEVSQFFLRVVKETVEYREKNGVVRKDFMQLLIDLKNRGKVDDDFDANGRRTSTSENGRRRLNSRSMSMSEETDPLKEAQTQNPDDVVEFTVTALAAQAFVFFLAGFETSSTAMAFCVHELAVNPDIQEKLQDEVDTVLERHRGVLSYECLQEMHYLDNVLHETLRKYPPAPNLIRKCTAPYTIPGTDVSLETGTRVVIPVYAIQNDPDYFPEPDKFDPDRFTEEEKAKRPHYTYMPFGEGPRICIGMRFGFLQAKVGLALLTKHYQFSVCEKTAVPLVFDPKSFVTTAKGGYWVRIEERKRED